MLLLLDSVVIAHWTSTDVPAHRGPHKEAIIPDAARITETRSSLQLDYNPPLAKLKSSLLRTTNKECSSKSQDIPTLLKRTLPACGWRLKVFPPLSLMKTSSGSIGISPLFLGALEYAYIKTI